MKRSGKVYQMNETTAFRADCHAKGNRYDNPYGSEYAMFRCEDGSSARRI